MKVYVIETHLLGGDQDIAIFDQKPKAERYIESHELHGKPEIVEVPVRGFQPNSDEVFTASNYDAARDIQFFEGAYGNHKDAEIAAGPNGLVLHRSIRH